MISIILEFFNEIKCLFLVDKVKVKLLSRVRLFENIWTVAYRAPPPMGFSRQECWSGLPFPSPGDLPDPGIKPGSPALQADVLPSEPPGKPIVNKTGVDVFPELFCFLDHPGDVNPAWTSGSSPFAKPGLENFEQYFASVC